MKFLSEPPSVTEVFNADAVTSRHDTFSKIKKSAVASSKPYFQFGCKIFCTDTGEETNMKSLDIKSKIVKK